MNNVSVCLMSLFFKEQFGPHHSRHCVIYRHDFSVELRVFVFCLLDTDSMAPFPMNGVAPVWLLMSLCAANWLHPTAAKVLLSLPVVCGSKEIDHDERS